MTHELDPPTGPVAPEADAELYTAYVGSKLEQVRGLLQFAQEKQTAETKTAIDQGLSRHNLYVKDAPNETPLEDAVSILLTPTGNHLVPGQAVTHIFLYYPAGLPQGDRLPMAWLKRVDISGEEKKVSISPDGVYEYRPSAEWSIDDIDTQSPQETKLPLSEVRDLLREVDRFLLTPQEVNVKIIQ